MTNSTYAKNTEDDFLYFLFCVNMVFSRRCPIYAEFGGNVTFPIFSARLTLHYCGESKFNRVSDQ